MDLWETLLFKQPQGCLRASQHPLFYQLLEKKIEANIQGIWPHEATQKADLPPHRKQVFYSPQYFLSDSTVQGILYSKERKKLQQLEYHSYYVQNRGRINVDGGIKWEEKK